MEVTGAGAQKWSISRGWRLFLYEIYTAPRRLAQGALPQPKAGLKSGGKAPPVRSQWRPSEPMVRARFAKLQSNLCCDRLTLNF